MHASWVGSYHNSRPDQAALSEAAAILGDCTYYRNITTPENQRDVTLADYTTNEEQISWATKEEPCMYSPFSSPERIRRLSFGQLKMDSRGVNLKAARRRKKADEVSDGVVSVGFIRGMFL